jgi:hypothetical protein
VAGDHLIGTAQYTGKLSCMVIWGPKINML